eukprot:TRINITY_DN7262_c0_g2_i1.p1 TRINITY_DN7262_c0_g2~~TRINITY_DN7262_c0_g2_i1.p1  ORF type:complete len:340 (-),score=44.60 TRINITY_DN7262_c0_g2_i1:280-1299(-)
MNITRKHVVALLLGQLLSLIIGGTGLFSQLLSVRYNLNAPTSQSLLNYILISFYSIALLRRGTFLDTLKTKTRYYLPLAIVDVEANYLVVKAYQYTTITSVMLLDCFTIPCVVILSYFVIGTRYKFIHIVAVLVCISGIVILVLSDTLSKEHNDSASGPIIGDILCLSGAFLYAVSNVGQEKMIKDYNKEEYLGMVGLYGTLVSGLQLAILEREELRTLHWSWGVLGCIVGFAACMFALYSLVPYMLSLSGATLFNLSLLTSDVFAIAVGIIVFHHTPMWLYFIAYGIIAIGIVMYTMVDPNISPANTYTTLTNEDQPDVEVQKEDRGAIQIESKTFYA